MNSRRFAFSLTWGLLSLVLVFLWLLTRPAKIAHAGTLTVCPAGPPDCTYSAIQDAVDAASPGDVVKVASGVYTGVNNYGGKAQVVFVNKSLTIDGGYTTTNWLTPDPTANPSILDAQGLGRVLLVGGAPTVVQGLHITGGDGTGLGGGPEGADAGGGVYLWGTQATFSDCVVYSNTASTASTGYGGGIYVGYAQETTLGHNLVIHNVASEADQGYGGGLYFNDWAFSTLRGNLILSNTASTASIGYGGGLGYRVDFDSLPATLSNNIVQGNVASTISTGYGGGLHLVTSNLVWNPPTLVGNTVNGNTASGASTGRGGGFYVEGPALITDNMVMGNFSSSGGEGYGGGLYLEGETALHNNIIQSNTASAALVGYGGGIYLKESLYTLSGNAVEGNVASSAAEGYGGGLYLDWSAVTFSDNAVVGNTASAAAAGYGGGLYIWATGGSTLDGNTLQDNIAGAGGAGYGGGLYLDDSDLTTLSGNLVQGNTASEVSTGHGGGMYVRYSDDTVLRGNAILENVGSAVSNGHGGGLHLYANIRTSLDGNTISANVATLNSAALGRGGGLSLRWSSSPILLNNLVARNAASTQGSGLWFQGGSTRRLNGQLSHTTIAENEGSGQGVFVGDYTKLNCANTIFAGHDTVAITVTTGSRATLSATVWYSNAMDTGGGGAIEIGTANFYGAPDFVNPDLADYHIGPNSSARDRGVDVGITMDLDGDPRPLGLGYDIGADEFPAALSLVKSASPDPVAAGGHLAYNLYLTNSGTVSLTATITDVLPEHVTPTGVLTWTLPSVLPGDLWTETVLVTVQAGYVGPLTNVVRVATEEGATGAYTRTVTTQEPIAGLNATNDSPTLLVNPATLTATVTGGSHVTYTWAFGDGSAPFATGETFPNGVVVTHTYPAAGFYTAVVTASNSVSELTATTQVTITPRTCWVRLNDESTDYLDVQSAVDASTHPTDVVKVAGYCAGVHSRAAPASYDGPSVITQVVYISKTLTVRGGYTTTNWIAPDPDANPTTLDAQRQGRVFYITGNISATVEGLNITGGKGSGLYVMYAAISLRKNKVYRNVSGWIGGGGLYVEHGTATLLDNSFTTNTSYSYGGGMRLHLSDATLTGNSVSSNTAHALGGGLLLDYGETMLIGNIIADNTTESGGGGVWISGDSTLISNTITGNSAQSRGGGLSAQGSQVTLMGNTVANNLGEISGGGIATEMSTVVLTGNTIAGNVTVKTGIETGNGGGLELRSSVCTLVNNLIADNQAGGYGSGLYTWNTVFGLFHNTIARNGGGDESGIHAIWWELSRPEICYNGRDDDYDGFWDCEDPDCCGDPACVGEPCLYIAMTLSNTILVSQTVGVYAAEGTTVTLEATLWGTATWANGDDWAGPGTVATGTVNLWGDPAFVDPDAGDYHIGPGSAAIDKGVDAGVTADLDGQARPTVLGFDIGADEFHGPNLRVGKVASTNPVAAGDPLTYTLCLTNNGTVSITAVITDFLPEDVTPTGPLAWMPPAILPGDVWTETVLVTVQAGYVGPLTNVVRVATEEGATGAYTRTIIAEQAIAGLEAANDSPTPLGSPTTLTATIASGSNVTYTWALGDGDAGAGAALTHTYPAAGIYTAAVTASNPVSLLTATTPVIVGEVIAGLVVASDSPTELGDATTLTATVASGSNVTYTWALGDGARDSGAVIVHAYPAPGVYTAVVSASNSVSQLTGTAAVVVDERIAGLEATNDSPTPLGSPTTLTATVAAGSSVTYTWAFGPWLTPHTAYSGFGYGAVVSHTYPITGVYVAVVTASNWIGELTATTQVIVEETPSGLVVQNDSPTVLGDATTFTATVEAGSHVTYTWDLGDGTVGQHVWAAPAGLATGGVASGEPFVLTHVYPAVGAYTALFTASNPVGTLTTTTPVTVDEAILGLAASNDSPTVLGHTTALTATVTAGSNVTYTWAFGDGATGSGAMVAHTYPSAGVYTAAVTASNSAGAVSAATVVTVVEPPVYIYLPLVIESR